MLIGATTALIFPLRHFTPVVSTGVVYLVAVIIISSRFGFLLGVTTALLSAAAFNWFHIPPTGRFTIAESENWVALVVFLIAAGFVSSLANQARTRTQEAHLRNQEATLLAAMSQLLLDATDTETGVDILSRHLAQEFQLTGLTIQLNQPQHPQSSRDRQALLIQLRTEHSSASLLLPNETSSEDVQRIRQRILPSLGVLIDGLLTRERLVKELVETQAIRQSDTVKTAILRSVSHDLRSPITAIVAAVDGLQSPTTDTAGRGELLEVVAVETQRLTRLIDQLITLAKMEAGQAAPKPRQCEVEDVILAAIHSTGKPATSFSLELPPQLPVISADPYQIERAIANLVENALRYSEDQHATVVTRVVKEQVEIRVIDRGPGVPSHLHEAIFQPFKRGEPAPAKPISQGGSGLGLAIAKGFVQANGGTLTLDSLPGQGSVFTISFPTGQTA